MQPGPGRPASAVSPAIDALPRAARREAARWFVELQADDATDDTRRRWQHWHDADPDHAVAWHRVQAFGDRLGQIPLPIARAALTPAASGPRVAGRRRQLLKSSVALVLVSAGAWLAAGALDWRAPFADRRTGIGERARIDLPDGSTVDLYPASAIDLRYTATERAIVLLGGDILVTTAADRPDATAPLPRPFVVRTRSGTVRALGTRFTVRAPIEGLLAGPGDGPQPATRVAVLEGSVEIRPAAPGAAATLVATGQQTRFSENGVDPPVPVDSAALGWLDGMIVARGMRLDAFLAELGRHRPGHLGWDPAIAGLRVSGTFPVADSDQVLAVLEATLPVRARRWSRYWVRLEPGR